MLRLRMADKLLNDELERASRGDRLQLAMGLATEEVREALRRIADGFNRAQQRLGDKALPDGRAATIRRAVANQPEGCPRSVGWQLEGFVLDPRLALSDRPPYPVSAGPSCRDIDGESYLCYMTIGSLDERRHRAFITLLLYLDLARTGYVCWIGREDERMRGLRTVLDATSHLRDFRTVDAAYHAMLETAAAGGP